MLYVCYFGDCLSLGGGGGLNLLQTQDAMSHGANSTRYKPSSPPARFPSSPEEEITICASGAPCSVHAKSEPKTVLICIAYNAITGSAMCGVTTKEQDRSQGIFVRMQRDDLVKVLHIPSIGSGGMGI